MHRFAAPIMLRVFAFDPACTFQPGKEAGECRLFDAEPVGQVALRELAVGEMRDGAPLRLAQAERAQALVELVPPDARSLVQEWANRLGVKLRHR